MRDNGLIVYSANLEVNYAAPLDARTTARLKTDLYDINYWKSYDSQSYIYDGLTVTVYGDTTENNGIYILIDKSDVSTANSWIKATNTSSGSLTPEQETKLNIIILNGDSSKYLNESGNYTIVDYSNIGEKPLINNVELIGNKTLAELGIQSIEDINAILNDINLIIGTI